MLQSIMGLSLEHTTYTIPPPSSTSHPDHVHARTPAQVALDSHLHVIRGVNQNISNRFFDKPFTLIVDPSTRAGATGEHSPVDALIPSTVAEFGIVQGVDVAAFEHRGSEVHEVDGRGWERLDWIGDDAIWKECDSAAKRAERIIDNSDDSVLWFDKYGTDWIKSISTLYTVFLACQLTKIAYLQMVDCLQTHSSRWRCNLRGIDNAASSPQHTRQY